MITSDYPCVEKVHSPGTTAQLSGARSTAELIAHYAGLPYRLPGGGLHAMKRGNPTPYLILALLLFEGSKRGEILGLLSACSDLGK